MIKYYRKAWVAVVGFVVHGLATGLFPDDYENWIIAAIAGLTAAGVWAVPNAKESRAQVKTNGETAGV